MVADQQNTIRVYNKLQVVDPFFNQNRPKKSRNVFWPIYGKKWIKKGPDVISFLSEDFVCL